MTLVPCKLLEHIVCSNGMTYLDECQLLSDRQYAFRKKHSCETQLTTIITKESRLNAFILDFAKAFDAPL